MVRTRKSDSLIAVGVAVLLVGAPYLLRLFGAEYADHASGPLRVLALSAIPNIVTATAVSACRAQRRTGAAVVILVCLCGSVLIGTLLALRSVGIAGAAWAWLFAQSAVAIGLVVRRSWWLPTLAPMTPAA